ncbi:hypothetical protein RB597_002845 [Gaeumannomyces tritici]
MGKKWRYGVILDAGSSGTRLHIYRWKDPAKARKHASPEELQRLPQLETKDKWTKKTRPGVSTFGSNPSDVGPEHLEDLVAHAVKYVPEHKQADTPIFLMATAGMRLLPQMQQKALLGEICSYLQTHTMFSLPDCDLHIQVIKGETEGLYGWVASNYLLGGFDRPDNHQHGKGHHTYGFLDMGGASAQIAFAPNSTEAQKHADDLKLLRLRTLDGQPAEHKVFTTTWLGFGVNQARERYVKSLVEGTSAGSSEIPDPCMPKGLRTTMHGEVVQGSASRNRTLIGTGLFNECEVKTRPLLNKDAPCVDHPCLLNGQHVPAIDFDVNHFVGVSEYWHTTHGVFGKGDTAYDFTTYQQRVRDFCNQDWDDIEAKLDTRGKHKVRNAQEACFKASWLLNVLHEGIGIPRLGLDKTPHAHNVSKGALESAKDKGFLDPFKAVDTIDGVEVSWTLGKMVLYAAGQVPPAETSAKALPVGFGSNAKGVPDDFNHAGSTWNPISQQEGDGDDWGDAADDILEKARSKSTSGFLLFILILVVLAYIFRKKDRRLRLFSKINGFTRRSRRAGSPRKGGRGLTGLRNKLFGRAGTTNYERLLEDGEAEQFALGDIDSDGSEGSDSSSSEGSASSGIRRQVVSISGNGRSSGLATPKLNMDVYDEFRAGSAIDRSGLVVRTESRERLVPTLQMSNAGRRSRASSPTRLKSPMKSPLQET